MTKAFSLKFSEKALLFYTIATFFTQNKETA